MLTLASKCTAPHGRIVKWDIGNNDYGASLLNNVASQIASVRRLFACRCVEL
jgi:hypothetical protein